MPAFRENPAQPLVRTHSRTHARPVPRLRVPIPKREEEDMDENRIPKLVKQVGAIAAGIAKRAGEEALLLFYRYKYSETAQKTSLYTVLVLTAFVAGFWLGEIRSAKQVARHSVRAHRILAATAVRRPARHAAPKAAAPRAIVQHGKQKPKLAKAKTAKRLKKWHLVSRNLHATGR